MGNHAVGVAIGLAAEEVMRRRDPSAKAIDILDRLCAPYRNSDAEWEAADPNRPGYTHPDICSYTDPHPKAALGMLMLEAFAPNGVADLPRYEALMDSDAPGHEVATDAWWGEVYTPFKQRYNFW